VLRGDPQPRVSFNYHGQWGSATGSEGLYQSSLASIAPETAPDAHRSYLLDVTGMVSDGDLELGWTYSSNVHDEQTVRRLAGEMLAALREIIEHCALPGTGGATPSDFPRARLSQRQVDLITGTGDIEDVYPLTPLQTGMVFHSLLDAPLTAGALDGSPGAYFDQVCVRLSGVSDPQALAEAWQRVVDRTAVLRAAVVWQGVDDPVQVCHPSRLARTVHLGHRSGAGPGLRAGARRRAGPDPAAAAAAGDRPVW
jgi:non-ribosomal peptide synthase protein (TIGR01720 family)